MWADVAAAALRQLDVKNAIAAFRNAGDASKVLALEAAAQLDDHHQVAGHVLALVEKDYDAAQQMFLRAKDQRAALQMRKDLKHWSAALKLAEQFDGEDTADILSQHAALLEMQGDAAAALSYFEVRVAGSV